MPNKKINELNTKSAVNNTDVIPIADPTSGVGEKTTVASLPFYKGTVSNNIIPLVTGTNTVGNSILSQSTNDATATLSTGPAAIDPTFGSFADVNGRIRINETANSSVLAINTLGQNTGGEQHAIDIKSRSNYCSIDLKNSGTDNTGGLSALHLISGPSIGGTQGQYQVFVDKNSFTRVRTGKIKFSVGEMIFGGVTEDTGDEVIRVVASNTNIKNLLVISNILEYADNAAAVTAGLAVGSVYRTGDLLKIVHA